MARFGDRFDAQGVLSGSKDAARCIGYLTKYLTKQVADCHQADTDTEHAHAARLADALRYEPCSPRCANWLRYGIQPKTPGPASCPARARARPTTATPRLRRAPCPDLAQMVGQDAGRPPGRPEELAHQHARDFGNRPRPVRLGTRRPGRPRPHGTRPATPARRRRPTRWQAALTKPDAKQPCTRTAMFRQREGGMTARHEGKAVPVLLDVEEAADVSGPSRGSFAA